jgi:hypothetical protein
MREKEFTGDVMRQRDREFTGDVMRERERVYWRCDEGERKSLLEM